MMVLVFLGTDLSTISAVKLQYLVLPRSPLYNNPEKKWSMPVSISESVWKPAFNFFRIPLDRNTVDINV